MELPPNDVLDAMDEVLSTSADLKHRLRKQISGTNVCVLSTTDIVDSEEPRVQLHLRKRDEVFEYDEKYGLKATTIDSNGKTHRFWSTGVLEMALAMGFVVWIISTRKAVGPHDSWWTKLVPGMQTIMHGPNLGRVWKGRILAHFKDRIDEESLEELDHQLNGDDSGDGTYNTNTTVPFIVWAILSGLEWPIHTWDDYDPDDNKIDIKRAKPEFWTSGMAMLADQGLIVRSTFFTDQMEKLDDEIREECLKVIRERKANQRPRIPTLEEHTAQVDADPTLELDTAKKLEEKLQAERCTIGRGGICINCGSPAGDGSC